jgi:hypothetical protein
MKDGTVGSLCSKLAAGAALGALLWATPALAETPPADATPAMPATPPDAPPPAPAPAPAVVAPAPVAPPVTSGDAMAATRPDVLPPIDVGAWSRVGGVFQGATDPKKLNDWHMDNAYVELHAGGKITKKVGVTLNLNSNMAAFPNSSFTSGSFVAIEDAIISFDLADEFHIWGGHLLVPVDRANASGPFFMIPWNYPGFWAVSHGIVAAPAEGPSGRNNGAVIWGDLAGAKVTYLAGAFDNANVTTSPLFSGRIRLDLLDPEGGFWGNASFFGDKDILSIGVGGQFQKHGSSSPGTAGMPLAVPPVPATPGVDKDYGEVNVDALFEKKIPGGSWFTAEGAYYHYNVLSGGVSNSMYALVAYASPTVGVGNIQPMVRYQWAGLKDNTTTNPWNVDAGLSYLMKGPALRLLATYGHSNMGPSKDTANSVQLGAQAIFF